MGAFLLSEAPFHEMPYIIVDYKIDGLLNNVTAEEKSIHADPPNAPGLYIVHPMPHEEEAVENFLWKVHANNNTGLYFDEGFMVAKSHALETLLMQGRSKNISCYVLTQRPVFINRHAFSEASYFYAFHLNDRRDRMKVKEFFGGYNEGRMPEFHSQWYDVKKDCNFILQPVPDADTIRERITARLSEMRDKRQHRNFI